MIETGPASRATSVRTTSMSSRSGGRTPTIVSTTDCSIDRVGHDEPDDAGDSRTAGTIANSAA